MSAHAETIRRNCDEVGSFYVACERLDDAGSFSLSGDEIVPIASMYKVVLALEVADQFVRGDLDAAQPHRVTVDLHSPGGAGLNQFAHTATVTARDLLYLSLALSDNTASDILLAEVGLESLHRRADMLGLDTIQVTGSCQTLLRDAGADFGYPSDLAAIAADWAPRTDSDDLVLDRTTRGSVADLARLMTLLASDDAAAPEACRTVLDMMTRQVWTARFAAAFPSASWSVASKTGTLSPWRGECGIVTDSAGSKLAIAVAMRQHYVATPAAVVDSALADVAAAAVQLALGQ